MIGVDFAKAMRYTIAVLGKTLKLLSQFARGYPSADAYKTCPTFQVQAGFTGPHVDSFPQETSPIITPPCGPAFIQRHTQGFSVRYVWRIKRGNEYSPVYFTFCEAVRAL